MTFTSWRTRVDARARPRAVAEGERSKWLYRSRVKARVARLVPRVPVKELYHRSLGAFPKVVKEALLELMTCGYQVPPLAPADAQELGDLAPWEDDELDLIDSQWYFDQPSAELILSFMPEGARSVVALGTPTVAAAAAAAGIPRVQLFDISLSFQPGGHAPAWADLKKIDVEACDLDEEPVTDIDPADVVVMDPPWHLENYQAWLQTAVRACKVGGLLAVALPQPLTNRKAQSELRELHRILSGIGRVIVKPGILSYVTPSFELPVLDIDGLGFLRRWRPADLALVRAERPEVTWESAGVGNLVWSCRRVEGRVVRTWGETRSPAVPVITPADPSIGYRLASVGRSYLRSSGINLVTSRGRAAVVNRWGRLPEILDLLQNGYPVDVAAKTALLGVPDADHETLTVTIRTLLER
jgi:hypothetical protein